MKFYGRTEQENKLHRIFRKEEMQTVLIYGRRRVGKSELIRHCLQKENALQLNYECRETAEKSNVDNLSLLLSDILQLPSFRFSSMEELL